MSESKTRPGRNDPCPCGSGSKFKFCCLSPTDTQADATIARIQRIAILSSAGRYAELEVLARRLIESHPDSGIGWKALGESLQRQGRDSRKALQRAADLLPDDAEAQSNLGAALRLFGQVVDAVAAYRRALAIRPDLAVVHGNLGNALRDLGRNAEAMASYRRALDIDPNLADVHNNLGNVLHDLGQLDDAVASYRRALQCNPAHADAQSNLGSVLMHLGKIDEAEKSLSKAIELSSGQAKSLAAALLFIPYSQDDSRFERLESLYARRESLPLADRIKLGFAMGRAMENIGQYDRSFGAYAEANRLFHDGHPFDEAADVRYVDDVLSYFSRELFGRLDAIAEESPLFGTDRVPIFIVGMPRSGTSLIEQMLASHPAVFGAGELTKLAELSDKARLVAPNREATLTALRDLGREYLDHVGNLAPGARYFTDKMPGNYQLLWLIRLALPNAKIIHSVRDPMDTCFSCYAMRFTSGHEWSYELGTLGRKYLRYRRLIDHWREAIAPAHMLEVRYEENVADPERSIRRMLDFLGLPWDETCLRFYETERHVRTASAAQVRRPIYSESVSRWRNYSRHLQRLFDIVQPT